MIKRMDEEAKASFEEMYLTYQDTLRRLAYAYDIPVDDIDDIIQDTFVSYARYDYSLKQPEEGKKILLGRILRSRCMDFHRQKKKRYCEDLNGETFAAASAWVSRRFLRKRAVQSDPGRSGPYAGKLAESCGVEINRRTANQ